MPTPDQIRAEVGAALAGTSDPGASEALHRVGELLLGYGRACESGLAASILTDVGRALRAPHEQRLQLDIFG